MAQAGTTPQGSEPQTAGTEGTPIGSSGEGGNSNSPRRKIAGKFDSLEEAVEKGYTGLEQQFHQVNENVTRLTRIMEAAMAGGDRDPAYRAAPVGRGGAGGGYPDPYGRGQPAEDDVDPKDFILNPGQYLRQREEKLMNLVGRVVSNAVSQAQIVQDFKSQNPDLVKHERLVQGFMAQLDPRLPLDDRLREAAKSTRAYLAQMKAEFTGQPARVPAGSEYVEPARGGQEAPGVGNPAPQTLHGGVDEQELVDYINERQQLYASHFGAPQK